MHTITGTLSHNASTTRSASGKYSMVLQLWVGDPNANANANAKAKATSSGLSRWSVPAMAHWDFGTGASASAIASNHAMLHKTGQRVQVQCAALQIIHNANSRRTTLHLHGVTSVTNLNPTAMRSPYETADATA